MIKFFASFALAALAFALAPQVLKAADPLCPLGNATLHGTYIVSGAGTLGGASITAVGEITWDGQGNTTATYTVSLGGTIHKGVTVTGSYHINPDCTGSHAESDGSHYDFVAAPNGSGTTWISTDAGAVVAGTTVHLKPVDSAEAEAQIRHGNRHIAPSEFRRSRKASPDLRVKTTAVTQQLPHSS
jgi:hypothetical protein